MYVSYLAPDLPWGGHFPDQFLWAFLLSFAVRGLVSRTGAGDSHMCMDTRGGRRPFLRFLSRGGIKTAKVSLSPVRRSLPLLERRVIQRLGKVSPRCHLSLLLWKRRLCLEIVWADKCIWGCRGTVGMGTPPPTSLSLLTGGHVRGMVDPSGCLTPRLYPRNTKKGCFFSSFPLFPPCQFQCLAAEHIGKNTTVNKM